MILEGDYDYVIKERELIIDIAAVSYLQDLSGYERQLFILWQSRSLYIVEQIPLHLQVTGLRRAPRGHVLLHTHWHVSGSWTFPRGHFMTGQSHLQVTRLRIFGFRQTMFLGHSHPQVAWLNSNGLTQLVCRQAHSQVFTFSMRG